MTKELTGYLPKIHQALKDGDQHLAEHTAAQAVQTLFKLPTIHSGTGIDFNKLTKEIGKAAKIVDKATH